MTKTQNIGQMFAKFTFMIKLSFLGKSMIKYQLWIVCSL